MLAIDSAALRLWVDCIHSDSISDSQGTVSPVGLLCPGRSLVPGLSLSRSSSAKTASAAEIARILRQPPIRSGILGDPFGETLEFV